MMSWRRGMFAHASITLLLVGTLRSIMAINISDSNGADDGYQHVWRYIRHTPAVSELAMRAS